MSPQVVGKAKTRAVLKTSQKKPKKKKEEVKIEFKPPRIVLNVFHTQYEIIEEVAKKNLNWKLSRRDPWNTQIEWDIAWVDVAPALGYWKEMKPF